MSYLLHDPDSGPVPYSVDFTDVLPTGDSLSSVSWSVVPSETGGLATTGASSESGDVSTQSLDAGIVGNVYRVTARATTSDGNVLDKSITIRVGEK